MRPFFLRIVMLAVLLALAGRMSAEDDKTAKALQILDGLRGIQVPKKKGKIDELNKRMDAAWSFFDAHKETLAVVDEELAKATAARDPDQFFLMDMSFLLLTQEGAKASGLAVAALERLDPKAEIIRANWVELFHLAMALGATGKETARYLVQMDRIYLGNKMDVTFFVAPHYVQLNPADVRCMVYGVAGGDAARHLASLLSTASPNRSEALRTLRTVGSEENTPEVRALFDRSKDFETIAVCVGFLMEIGGPSGRAAVIARDARGTDAEVRKYLEKMQAEAEKYSIATMVAALARVSPPEKIAASDGELQRLLDKMEEHNGEDFETSPLAVAKSGLATDRLLSQLKRIRARSFRRETNHVFEDLQISNLLINILQYRIAKS